MAELLIAVSIVLVLAALALPALRQARVGARKTACVSNLRQVAMAVSLFRGEHENHFPTAGLSAGRWVDQLTPYVGNSLANDSGYQVAVFHCPLTPRWAYTRSMPGANGCYGINNAIAPYADGLGVSYFAVKNPAAKVLFGELTCLGYKGVSPNTPGVINSTAPFPLSPAGAAANHRFDENPAKGPDGPSNYLFCDGHVETLTAWPGAPAFNPTQ